MEPLRSTHASEYYTRCCKIEYVYFTRETSPPLYNLMDYK